VKFPLVVTAEVLKGLKHIDQFAEFLMNLEIKKKLQSTGVVLLICCSFNKQFDL
jgi:hypothetical protein